MSLQKFIDLANKARLAKTERFAEDSKKRFDKILSTKVNTVMIGAIAAFEESFGFLWGKGKAQEDLTTEELEFSELWQNVRNKVLNNGNNQLRALKNELANNNVTWKRYHINLPMLEENDENVE